MVLGTVPSSRSGTEEPLRAAVDLPERRSALGESVAHRRVVLRCRAPGRSTAAGAIYVLASATVAPSARRNQVDLPGSRSKAIRRSIISPVAFPLVERNLPPTQPARPEGYKGRVVPPL